eukprot:CAMPEP_0173429278 /NCGR_PEP_ID=MMETSP1357-20121228/8033_1 /TAXON_ID=77926 /ORGANISM="Hemiselmis rufescens, Strain PCC563" /LENGTH=282 /DNA_ID=CAMNT_0014393435 /DNA_START=998 /DNA_END=1843 /DNA_ORIENTATION=-
MNRPHFSNVIFRFGTDDILKAINEYLKHGADEVKCSLLELSHINFWPRYYTFKQVAGYPKYMYTRGEDEAQEAYLDRLTATKKSYSRDPVQVVAHMLSTKKYFLTVDLNDKLFGSRIPKLNKDDFQFLSDVHNGTLDITGTELSEQVKKTETFLFGNVADFLFKSPYTVFTIPKFPVQPTNLVLVGPPGIGKTHFASAHFKKCFLCSNVEDLLSFSKDYDGIVFDDIDFLSFPIEVVIKIVDNDPLITRTFKVRYKNVVLRPVPKIFTHNHCSIFWNDDCPE